MSKKAKDVAKKLLRKKVSLPLSGGVKVDKNLAEALGYILKHSSSSKSEIFEDMLRVYEVESVARELKKHLEPEGDNGLDRKNDTDTHMRQQG